MIVAARRGIAALVLLALCPVGADAFWFGNCGDACQGQDNPHSVKNALEKGAQKNIRWPSPYLCADRAHVKSPFDAMVTNGWRRQNLLGGHHFTQDATELTQSGKLKVRWIMTQVPPQYRQVFVERSLDEGVTDARIATAQDFASLVARTAEGGVPRIADTHIVSEGRPAATVDFVNTQFRDNMPTPALPDSSQGFEGGE